MAKYTEFRYPHTTRWDVIADAMRKRLSIRHSLEVIWDPAAREYVLRAWTEPHCDPAAHEAEIAPK